MAGEADAAGARRPLTGRAEAPGAGVRGGLSHLGDWILAHPGLTIAVTFVVSRLVMLASTIKAAHGNVVTAINSVSFSFDAGFYQTIVVYGYGRGPTGIVNAAFYPGYPLLAAALYEPLRGLQLAGILPPAPFGMPLAVAPMLLAANLSLVVALVALWRLYEPRVGRTATLVGCCLLLSAPSSFFLSSGFSESSFIAASALAFLFAERGRWVLAGAAVCAACLIRGPGAMLLLPLGIIWLQSRRPVLPALAGLAIAAAGIVAYPAYTGFVFGDPLLYEHLQASHWEHALSNPVDAVTTILHRGWWGVRALLHIKPSPYTPWIAPKVQALDGITLLWTSFCGLVGLVRRVPLGLPQAIWILLVVAYPLPAGGNPIGTNRLLFVAFPAFFLTAWWLRRRAWLAVPLCACGLAAMFQFTADHVTGRFVG